MFFLFLFFFFWLFPWLKVLGKVSYEAGLDLFFEFDRSCVQLPCCMYITSQIFIYFFWLSKGYGMTRERHGDEHA